MLPAPLVRLVAAVVLTTSERTVEVPPIGVPRMRQKSDPAMAAVDRTACQTRIIAQDRIERSLVLPNKRAGAIVLTAA